MKEVLFIALEFAPIQQTGAFRSIRFAKHLPQQGIRPLVLTIDPTDASKIFSSPINSALQDQHGGELRTYYLRDAQPPGKYESPLQRYIRLRLRTTDGFYNRLRKSLPQQLEAILANHNPSAIYVSLPPFGAGSIALDVAEKTGLPLIVDMRDAWSQWANAPFPSYIHYRSTLHQERELFSQASAIITVTEELSQIFQRTHPYVPAKRFHVIANGIDNAQGDDLTCRWGDDLDRFKVAYVGSYYYNPMVNEDRDKKWFQRPPHRWLNYLPVEQDWLYRTPYFFLSALSRLREFAPQAAERFQFHQIGDTPAWLTEMATQFGLVDQIVSHGVVPKEQVGKILASMDACLVTSIKVPGGDDYCLASKTFDYLQANKLLLGFVCRGSQRTFLQQVGGSVICDADEIDANAQTLCRIVDRASRYAFDPAVLPQYQAAATTQRLAQILDSVIDDPGARKHRAGQERH